MKELTLEITDNCSLNCVHCSTEASPEGEIIFDRSKVSRILQDYEDFEIVRLSGGEPFNNFNLEEICQDLKQRGKIVKILSCGVRYGRPLPRNLLKRLGPFVDEIIFSYYGEELVHEEIVSQTAEYWNHPPYWEQLCDSLDNATLSKIPYSFETVVMKKNFPLLKNISKDIAAFSAAREWNLDEYMKLEWHILKFVKQGRGRINSQEELSKWEASEVPKILEDLQNKYDNISITYSNSFGGDLCECGSKKAVYTCYDEKIPCSALKENCYLGKFACKK